MRIKRFEWEGVGKTGTMLRAWGGSTAVRVDVETIEEQVLQRRDAAVLELTNKLDATEHPIDSLRVDAGKAAEALASLDPELRESLEMASANIHVVAEAQLNPVQRVIPLLGGQSVAVREVPVGAAGIYAPGGRAAYPSSVLMCAIPALVAGVTRIALASPPGPDGSVSPFVLAAAALCEIEEIYAMGGAQAIFALAYETETVKAVNVIVGPGNVWVQEAKRRVSSTVGIDSYAGPSELMLIAGHGTDAEWAALDLCAQAEHGAEGPLVAVSVEEAALDAIADAVERIVGEHARIGDAPLALVQVPDLDDAIDLANDFAPEHLELMVEDAAALADRITTAGCIFVGPYGATAFGDYVAGSNHVLPTGGAGRFSGPLGPHVFRRKISTVEVSAEAAAKLAPHVDRIARAEGFPVHGESAMIRAEKGTR